MGRITLAAAGVAVGAGLLLCASPARALEASGLLEIHTINVQQGSATLVIGPDGTTVLLDAGSSRMGYAVAKYLRDVGIVPSEGIDYTIAGHMDGDHMGGFDNIIRLGFDVRVKNYYNGSRASTTGGMNTYLSYMRRTTAGAPVKMRLGQVIPLGRGARLTVLAVDGEVLGHGHVSGADGNENDLSIAVLVEHGGFDYFWASDLGGGDEDRRHTGRSSWQVNLETPIARAITPGGRHPMLARGGLDVLAVSHHGSESSTNMDLMNLLAPEVAIIPVGEGQEDTFEHPRRAVVENVLLARAPAITAPPALVLQTAEGSPRGRDTSTAGYCCGDIKVTTDGRATYTVSATGRVGQGPDERRSARLPRTFRIDESSVAPANQPPMANAGPDLTVEDDDADGLATVVIDGEGDDPEGDALRFAWRAGSDLLAGSARLVATLPVGTHRLALTVEDRAGLEDTDTVTVTVRSNRRPTARAGPDVTVADNGGDGGQRVTLDGGASTDPDGPIVDWRWTEGSTVLSTSARLSRTLRVGTHTITLTVTDAGGLTDSDTVVVRVVTNEPPVADAGDDRTSRDGNGDGVVGFILDGSGSRDPDGRIVEWRWTDAWGRVVGERETIRVERRVGQTHTFTLRVTDDLGSYRTDRIRITTLP